MKVEKCPFFTFVLSMASSGVLFGHGVETSHLGDASAQELCQAIGDVLLEQVGIDVSAPCKTKYARSSRKVQENKILCDVGPSCNVRK